ncbi:MAG: uracil-DNA glycosylase family protein [Methylobacter sp.]
MLIGQAPGLTEYRTGSPFSGQAGRDIRKLFEECRCDAEHFERIVFTSAIAKCFPGSKLVPRRRGSGVRREDLIPSPEMLKNCSPFLLAQLELVNPQTVVLLGKMALKVYVELRTGRRANVRLEDYVGQVQDWNGRRVIALAHTSGASTWLTLPARKALQEQAKRHLAIQLAAHIK